MKTNSYINSLENSKTFLEQLPVDEDTNAIWDILHLARWHKGIDWVRWINENKELVLKLIKYDYFSKCPDTLKDEVWDSIYKLKKLDR